MKYMAIAAGRATALKFVKGIDIFREDLGGDEEERKSLVQATKDYLANLCDINKETVAPKTSLFHSPEAELTSLDWYISRIARYSESSNGVFIIALIYLDRIAQKSPDHKITKDNVHKLYLVASRIANKWLDLNGIDNKDFAVIGGVQLNSLNQMELEFIKTIGFEMHVSKDEYSRKYEELLS